MDIQSNSSTEDYLNLYSSTLRSLVSDAEAIRQISDMAEYLNVDEVELKPLDQATHGVSVKNLTQF